MSEAAMSPELGPDAPDGPDGPVSFRGWEQAGPDTSGSPLEDVRAWFVRFVSTVHDSDLDLLSLWAAHTHLVMETYTTPRLLIDSPVPGSGKTTTLEHLDRLCVAPVQMATLSSPAMLARLLDAGMRTILIDEADRSLSPDKEGIGDLLAVLNSGYKRGAPGPDPGEGRVAGQGDADVLAGGDGRELPEPARGHPVPVHSRALDA
jgi:hypothetical protein